MNDTNFVENFSYNIDGRVKQYVKRFFGELLNTCGDIEPTSYDVKSYDNSEDWRYRYSPLGGREQKRLYYSPQGDGKCYPFSNYHPWTYYVLGANGEQTAVYKGVQTSD